MAINYDHQRDRITSTSDVLTISTTGALGVPVGNTAQRPTAASGQIRFNTQLQSFEGYNGSGWSSLGGIVDVDQDTKITAESAPGSDEDTLTFTTAGVDRASINNAGLFNVVSQLTVGGNVQFNGTLNTHTIPSGTGTIALTSDLYTDSDVDTHLNQGSAITNQVLSWDGTDYNWITNSGAGIVLSDISVGAEGTAAGDGGITYDNITGVFTYIPPVLSGITGNTDDITEGTTNLYYTTVRANADFDTRLATKSTTDLAEGTNLYYTAARDTAQFNTDLATKSTTDLAEGTNLYYTDARARAVSLENIVEDTTPQLGGNLDLNSKDITGTGNINITGNAVISGYLAGPANFVIDPAGVGDNTGKVVIAGDLQVDGTTTTINSTTLDVDDLNITVAKGAADSAAANGAGLTVDGAGANITYTHATTSWDFNKDIILSGDFLPDGDETRDIGSSTKKWKDLYLSGSTIKLGAGTLNATGTVIGSPGGFDLSVNDTDDLSEGTTNLYYTSARFNAALAAADSDDLSEGSTNLYYTDARADARIAAASVGDLADVDISSIAGGNTIVWDGVNNTFTTADHFDSADFAAAIAAIDSDDISEGAGNLYFTNARARGAISAGGDLSYDSATGVMSFTQRTNSQVEALARGALSASGDLSYNSTTGAFSVTTFKNADWDTKMAAADTDDLSEGSTNLYYTSARANADFDTKLAGADTDDLAEGSNNLYYTQARFNTAFGLKSTTDLSEGSNLYFTNARARSSISVTDNGGDGSVSYDSSTGVISYTGPSAAEVRAHVSASGDLTYTQSTGVFSVTTYKSTDFDTDFGNKSTDDLLEGATNLYYTDARVQAVSINEVVEDITPQLGGDLDLNSKDITGTGNINITGNATVSGYLAGPANFVIDPAGVGDNTGKVVIAGDLQVDGTTTTINSTILDVDDLNITVAKGSASAAAANGAGLTVDGASATLTYTNADDRWNLNKELNVSRVHGNVTGNVTGTVSDISNHDTDALSEGSTNLYFTDARTLAKINVSSINELSDVDTATTPPTNGQVLVYDGNTTEWVPGTVSGGGGGNSLFQLLNL